MADVYIYAPDCEDFATIGECGRLTPTKCEYEEIAGGLAEITMEHPLDALKRYTLLRPEAILKVQVPVRTTPEIVNGEYVTSVARYTVKNTTTKAERTVYSKPDKGKKVKVLKWGDDVIVVGSKAGSDRVKCKVSKKKTGWIELDSLDKDEDITIPDTPDGIESVVPSWVCKEQLFRIYNVTKADQKITVNARHISYDLSHNITTYENEDAPDLQEALDGILSECLDEHDFEAFTDISGTRAGTTFLNRNPMEALLDPDEGCVALWNAQLVRDDWELYLLHQAGENRGVRIEYAKNLKGIDMSISTDDVVTHLRPVAKDKKGKPLYLPEDDGLVPTGAEEDYPYKKIEIIELNEQVSKKMPESVVLNRMREAAQERIDEGCGEAAINAKIDFLNLGNTPRYAQYRNLQNVFLYDTIRIVHTPLGIDVEASVSRIRWDCLLERMNDIELGELQDLSPRVAAWQLPGNVPADRLLASDSVGAALLAGDVAVYTLQVTSSSGDEISGTTTLTAHVYYGAEDVTDDFDASEFTWYKDDVQIATGVKQVTVQYASLTGAARYVCEVGE